MFSNLKRYLAIVLMLYCSVTINFFPETGPIKTRTEGGSRYRVGIFFNEHSPLHPYARILFPLIAIVLIVKEVRRKDDE